MSRTRAIGAIGIGAFASSFVAGNELEGGKVLDAPARRPTDYTAIYVATAHALATKNGTHGAPGPDTGRRIPLVTPAELDKLTDTWFALGDRIKARLERDDSDSLELFELDLGRFVGELHRIKRRAALFDADKNAAFIEQAEKNKVSPRKIAELLGFLLPFDQLVITREPIRFGPSALVGAAPIDVTEAALTATKKLAIGISAADFVSELEQADFAFFMRELGAGFAELPRDLGEFLAKAGAGIGETVAHAAGGLIRGLLESPLGAALAIGAAAVLVRAGAAKVTRGSR